MRAMEKAVLAVTAKPNPESRYANRQVREPSGEPCRLWNRTCCTYPKCRHSHVCSGSGGGNHPILSCPSQDPSQGRALQYPPGHTSQFQAAPRIFPRVPQDRISRGRKTGTESNWTGNRETRLIVSHRAKSYLLFVMAVCDVAEVCIRMSRC